MTGLHTLDARILDARLPTMNLVGGSSPGPRPRYNTQIMTKFIDTSDPIKLALARNTAGQQANAGNQYWDADLQSYMYLQDFVNARIEWRKDFAKVAKQYGVPSQDMDSDQLTREICDILELAPEREERFMEVIDQDDADGAVNYWLGMLQISPARHPATYLMVRVGRRIGEHVVMCLKGDFRSPRPSQLCPGIVPMIDPPATPTFPAGHAVQAYLISYLLAYSLPNIPQQRLDDVNKSEGPLFKLAYRVSQNRVVAGVHFPTDIIAGKAVGIECFKTLQEVATVWGQRDGLRAKVRDEFPQYA